MPLIQYITGPLLPGVMYHIYNRDHDRETLICPVDKNFRYFLKKYTEYMEDYMDTYAYCLLPDHYHLAVRIKSEDDVLHAAARDITKVRSDVALRLGLTDELRELSRWVDDRHVCQTLKVWQTWSGAEDDQQHSWMTYDGQPYGLRTKLASWTVSERFRRFLLGYTNAINKFHNRRGSLMQKPFRRKIFRDILGFKRLIRYIHLNPAHHGYVSDFAKYPWSSFKAYVSNAQTRIRREESLVWFGGRAVFLAFHGRSDDLMTFGEP